MYSTDNACRHDHQIPDAVICADRAGALVVRSEIDNERFSRGFPDFLESADTERHHERREGRGQSHSKRKEREEHERHRDKWRSPDSVRKAPAWQVRDDRHRLLHGIQEAVLTGRQMTYLQDEQNDEGAGDPFADADESVHRQQACEGARHAQRNRADPAGAGSRRDRVRLAESVPLHRQDDQRQHDGQQEGEADAGHNPETGDQQSTERRRDDTRHTHKHRLNAERERSTLARQ